jgi:transposase
MLTVEEHVVIKELYRRGISISEIARCTGRDRKTIRQRLAAPLLAERAPRAPRACKIDPYVPYLEQRLAEGVLNAHKLFSEIVAQGYPGGESQVKAFVQYRRPARQPEATVRFETAPGQQAQVDWGSFGTIAHEGRHRRLYAFVMTLGWSRVLYLEFTLSMEITWFLRGHQHAFAYFGGAPREVLHDNLKTAVLDRAADGTIHWHPRYLDFASYYGFMPHACRPYRAQTKGKVERGIGYVRGNFWPGVHAEDLADLNAQARVWLDTVANVRVHGTTGVVPFTRLPDEGLLSLGGKPPYDTSVVLTRQSTRDCLVSYAGNLYSVPAVYAQQRLVLRVTEQGELIILSPHGHEVARHTVARGQQQRIIQAAHYQSLHPAASPPVSAPLILGPRPPSADDLAVLLGAPAVEKRPLALYDQFLEEGV